MTNFFTQPMIPSVTPSPEPPGFAQLRQMLMNKAFQGNSNPFGLNPQFQGGASQVYTNGQNQPFSPYGGGGMSGGGWHSQGYGPAQQGGGIMSGPGGQGQYMGPSPAPYQGGGGMQTQPMRPGGNSGGPPSGGGGMNPGFMQFIQQLMQQMQGAGRGPQTMPMRPGGGGQMTADSNLGTGQIPGAPPGMATPPPQSTDQPPDRSRQPDATFDGMTHYDGDGCTSFDGDPYSGWQPGHFSTPGSIKPKGTEDNSAQNYVPPDSGTTPGYDGMGTGRMSHNMGNLPQPKFGNRISAGPSLGGPSGGMRQLAPLLDQLRPSRGPSPAARIGKPIHGIQPDMGMLR